MVEDYQAYQTRHLDGQLENQDVDNGRGTMDVDTDPSFILLLLIIIV